MDNKKKIKDYKRRAIKKYQDKFDNINVRLPAGTKEEIRTITGQSVNGYINDLVKIDLAKRKKSLQKIEDQDEKNVSRIEKIDPADIFYNYNEGGKV